jgi:hypothetical protein
MARYKSAISQFVLIVETLPYLMREGAYLQSSMVIKKSFGGDVK